MAQEQVVPDSLAENKDDVVTDSSTDQTQGDSSTQDENSESSAENAEPKSMEEAVIESLKDSMEPEGEAHTDDQDEQVPDEVKDIDGEPDKKPDEALKPEDTTDKTEAEPDPYEMPEGLKPQAQERFKTLANENKEFKEKVTAQDEHIEGVRNLFSSTGASQEELGKVFDYVTIRNTAKNPEELKPCLEFAQNEVARIKEAMGVVDEATLLDDHPDLKQEVDDFALTEDRAKEIATARNAEKIRTKTADAQTQQQDQTDNSQQQFESDRKQAADDIRVMSEKWAKNDIDFAAKNKVLLAKAPDIFKQYQPNQWPGIFKMLYDSAGVQKTKQKPVDPSLESGNNGSGKKTPKTQSEAILQNLGY